jgi:glycosyltransferase involved in cell wall biosynthesis
VVAAMQVLHRTLGVWRNKVDAFFTLTEFARQKFVDAGLPADRVHVKHNSVSPDPGIGRGDGYLALVGRLSPEKGITTVLEAWSRDASLPALKIVGDGPLAAQVQAAASADTRITWLGEVANAEANRVIGAATALLMPSLWYETFGRTIGEAFAAGTPVIASRLGAMAELVDEGQTGWLFAPGDATALTASIHVLSNLPVDAMAAMRCRARQEYERRFTPVHNYARLMEIYEFAKAHAESRHRTPVATAPRIASAEATPA